MVLHRKDLDMTEQRAMHRPVIIMTAHWKLDQEMRTARWIHHRLLDFEEEHQNVLDVAAEAAAPGINKVACIIARLSRYSKRRERTTKGQWSPNPHETWMPSLRAKLAELKKQRNADPRWSEALKWGDTPGPDAPDRGSIRRKASESDEAFEDRKAKRRVKLTRREQYRKSLYDAHVATDALGPGLIYWGTWNFLLKSVDRARKSVLSQRKIGMPAEWHRPKRDDKNSIAADHGGFRIINRGGGTRIARNGVTVGNPWWTLEIRISSGWVRFRAKFGTWHELPDESELNTCILSRVGQSFTVSISVSGMPTERTYSVGSKPNKPGKREILDGTGIVALDWGHREHGHPNEHLGLRVFTWLGDDDLHGEILLPLECRSLLDEIDNLKSRVDTIFNARKTSMQLPDRNRYGYRARLLRLGVVSEQDSAWLDWENRYEGRIAHARKRIVNLRTATYLAAVRDLRKNYKIFAFEDESTIGHRKAAIEDQILHRKRQNRELSARYEFKQICERYGGTILDRPARNMTRLCPWCGELHENTSDLMIACPKTGRITDKDLVACINILQSTKEALANEAAQ